MLKYISLLELLILAALAAGRGLMLKKRGINAFLFGSTDKSDFLLTPAVALLFYNILAGIFPLPMPDSFRQLDNPILNWCGALICAASLFWFFLTLKSFGDSFRIGIDEKAPDKLVTSGMFSISRNPIYVAFTTFVLGVLMIYPNVISCICFVIFVLVIHRQVLREENFLRNHYGEEYTDYCKRTRRYL